MTIIGRVIRSFLAPLYLQIYIRHLFNKWWRQRVNRNVQEDASSPDYPHIMYALVSIHQLPFRLTLPQVLTIRTSCMRSYQYTNCPSVWHYLKSRLSAHYVCARINTPTALPSGTTSSPDYPHIMYALVSIHQLPFRLALPQVPTIRTSCMRSYQYTNCPSVWHYLVSS